MYLDYMGQAKISDFEDFVFCDEHITTGQITMDNLQTGQVLLREGREGVGMWKVYTCRSGQM